MKKAIIILSVLLALSLALNISFNYWLRHVTFETMKPPPSFSPRQQEIIRNVAQTIAQHQESPGNYYISEVIENDSNIQINVFPLSALSAVNGEGGPFHVVTAIFDNSDFCSHFTFSRSYQLVSSFNNNGKPCAQK